MSGSDGQPYTALRSPDGNWMLGDIRQPQVRARFVQMARNAVQAGFDGVYLDGYAFWADGAGRVGGHAPRAEHSLAYARWQLLREIRAAIHQVNPNALLGLLGNAYYDTLGVADFIMKERMYFAWHTHGLLYSDRDTRINSACDREFELGLAPYVAKPLVYGSKGRSPIAVQSAASTLSTIPRVLPHMHRDL